MKQYLQIMVFIVIGLFLSDCKKKEINDLQGGVVTFALGSVKVKAANGEARDAKPESFVMFGETVVTGANSYADVQFMDGIMIRIKEKSELKITQIWVNSQSKEIRAALNLKGKLFSKNTAKMNKNSEFTVSTPTIIAGVRGTEFMVDEEKSTTYVNDGSVSVKTPDGKEEVVDAGKKASLDKKNELKETDLTSAEKAEMGKDSQSIQSITEDARQRINDILKDFEENKARIKQTLEEQKEANKGLIEGQKEGDKALLEEQKAKNKEMMDEVKGSIETDKNAIKEGAATEKNKILESKDQIKNQKKGNLKDQLAPN